VASRESLSGIRRSILALKPTRYGNRLLLVKKDHFFEILTQILLTYCDYVIYTVFRVTNQRRPCLLGPISPAADGTLYQQIVERLKREVSEGRLKPGTSLPSFRQLAEDLLVSVITVKRAYEELQREGIIYRRQGLGTFVAEQGRDRSREAKLAAARVLIRDGFREASEAGLKPADILELAREIQKERNQYDQRD
jgi:GntR family transcriptional regulator